MQRQMLEQLINPAGVEVQRKQRKGVYLAAQTRRRENLAVAEGTRSAISQFELALKEE